MDNKLFDIIDAQCNHEDYISVCPIHHIRRPFPEIFTMNTYSNLYRIFSLWCCQIYIRSGQSDQSLSLSLSLSIDRMSRKFLRPFLKISSKKPAIFTCGFSQWLHGIGIVTLLRWRNEPAGMWCLVLVHCRPCMIFVTFQTLENAQILEI